MNTTVEQVKSKTVYVQTAVGFYAIIMSKATERMILTVMPKQGLFPTQAAAAKAVAGMLHTIHPSQI